MEQNAASPGENLRGMKQKHPGKRAFRKELKKNAFLFLMVIPGILVLLVNNYLPMGGVVMAFQKINYKNFAFFGEWVGMKNLSVFLTSPKAALIAKNTLLYNFAFLITGTAGALFFAIGFNELRGKIKSKIYQTVMFLPYFMSWVVITYVVIALLNTRQGLVNNTLQSLFGSSPVNWYMTPAAWPVILVLLNIWKYAGYNSVIYLANLSGFDPAYYEAAAIDGATKWQLIWKITLPLLRPMIIIMTLLQIGRIFSTDIGLFYSVPMIATNGSLSGVTSTIDTYVYTTLMSAGTSGGAVNVAAAAAFLQSVLGFSLVMITNLIVRKLDPDQAMF